MIPLARPYLTPKARRNIERCFDENFFSQGFFNVQFEKEFAEYVGMDYATTCSNGTAALWLALKAAGVGPGDEVIVPTLTFTGSVGPIASVGARPVFVDSNPEDGNISPAAVAAALTPHTKAVIAVDLYGISADYAGLRKVLAKRNDIVLIEDAAEGLGGTHQGKPIGHAGDISCFSFFGNKILTTGEGGMCTTNNQKFHDAMVLYKNHGIGDRHYWVEVAGFNMRMTNLQAGIGVSQLEALPELLAARYEIFDWYAQELNSVPTVTQLPFTNHSFAPWLFTVKIPGVEKNDAVAFLKEKGIDSRPGFFPLHRTPAYRALAEENAFPVADDFSKDLINLPTFIGITKEEITYIVSALKELTAYE